VLHGSIVLQVEGERHPLGPGDRLMLPKGTRHSAEVGPEGATYLIGQRR
jgi:quercetin dioxygenase-like cupin family protein